jgi:hypothetical protein
LGVGPNWSFGAGNATFAIPIKVGLSLKDFYEGQAGDEKFGFVDAGVLVTVPLTAMSGKLGRWSIHGGVDFLALGKTTKAFNKGDANQLIVMGGVGWSQ